MNIFVKGRALHSSTFFYSEKLLTRNLRLKFKIKNGSALLVNLYLPDHPFS